MLCSKLHIALPSHNVLLFFFFKSIVIRIKYVNNWLFWCFCKEIVYFICSENLTFDINNSFHFKAFEHWLNTLKNTIMGLEILVTCPSLVKCFFFLCFTYIPSAYHVWNLWWGNYRVCFWYFSEYNWMNVGNCAILMYLV